LVGLFQEPQHLDEKPDESSHGYTEIDYEEQTAGYQASFSKLAAAESAPADCVAYAGHPQEFVRAQLAAMTKAQPEAKNLLLAGDTNIIRPFLQTIGYVS
jgi:exportin-2 (importin alpha re-exporter)